MNDFAPLLPVATEAVDLARELFLTHQPGTVTVKGDRDMASEVDYAIERKLAAFLREKTPGIGFLGEEHGNTGVAGQTVWTLDPIDGTVNFIHGSPLCGISLALVHEGVPVLGVVDLPRLGSRYAAVQGHGAYAGDRRLSVSTTDDLTDAVIAIGDYAVGADAEERNRVRLAITAKLAATVQRVRMHGSAAIDLVWVAEGLIDGMIMMSNKPWDTAAGVIIAREAGASVVDRSGMRHSESSTATIAANPTLAQRIVSVTTETGRAVV